MQVKISSTSSVLDQFDFSNMSKGSLGVKLPGTLDVPIGKFRCEIPIKLELHLRNSEVVAIPLFTKNTADRVHCSSHTWIKPVQGTHDGLYMTFVGDKLGLIHSDEILFNLYFISKNFWKQVIKKDTDGLQSSPIQFIWYLTDLDSYMLFNLNPIGTSFEFESNLLVNGSELKLYNLIK